MKSTKKAIQYGAGNIGRGFIGQLFSKSGYEVVFVDVNKEIVDKINSDRTYPVKIISEKGNTEVFVENVRAVNGMDMESVADEISSADLMATAVGVNILPRIAKPIAEGLKKRWSEGNWQSLNIIICENLIDADKYLSKLIKAQLSENEMKYFEETVGLVEASIGRMVPVMTPEMQEGNLLRVCVEEYEELPVDKNAFKGRIPDIVNMKPFSPFEFYIQRKLFIHNMGHAITSYLGYVYGYKYIWEAIKDTDILQFTDSAMRESGEALSREHGVPIDIINQHIDNLIERFGNRGLGDTIERVGKDPIRKLGPNDRLVGALNLCKKHDIEARHINVGIAAALVFNEASGNEALSAQDSDECKIREVLENVCKISSTSIEYKEIHKLYKMLHHFNNDVTEK